MIDHLKNNRLNAPFKAKLGTRNFNDYIAKKSATTGEYHTWSDHITMSAMAGAEGRNIKQVTFPCYRNGVAIPEEGPKIFNMTSTGDSSKPPIFIHYNGHNHYNAIVSVTPPEVNTYAGVKVDLVCKICTFVNPKGVSKCEVCTQPLTAPLIKAKDVQKPQALSAPVVRSTNASRLRSNSRNKTNARSVSKKPIFRM